MISIGRLLLVVLLLQACSEKPQLQPLPADTTVLAFGDSLTLGSGVEPRHSYPAVLEQLSELGVVNAGVAGELSDSGLQRLPGLLQQHRPGLVILTHGGNDLLRGRDSEQISANLAQMIALVADSGSQVLLVAVPRPGLFPESAGFYAELARQYQVPLEPGIVAELEADGSAKSDRVHFNQAGYRRMAEAIYQLMVNRGAVQ